MRKLTGFLLGRTVGILALVSMSLLAEEFTGTLTLTNVDLDNGELVFGFKTGATSDIDDAYDATRPPPAPDHNYAGFWIGSGQPMLKTDYRAPTTEELWILNIAKIDPFSTVSMSWTAISLTEHPLQLLDSAENVLVEDMTVAGSRNMLGGTYYIRYGTPPIPEEAAVDVIIIDQDSEEFTQGEWYITKTSQTGDVYDSAYDSSGEDVSYERDANDDLVTDNDGAPVPIWRSGTTTDPSGRILSQLSTEDTSAFTIHYKFVDLSWDTPLSEDIQLNAGDKLYVFGVYNRVLGEVSLSKTVLSTPEDGQTDSFVVSLSAQPLGDVVIDLTPNVDATVVSLSETSHTFTTENWDTSWTVTATGATDDYDNGDRNYSIDVTVTSDDGNDNVVDDRYDGYAVGPVTGTTVDDDTAGFNVSPTSIVTTESGAGASIAVSLGSKPEGDVVIDIAVSDDTEVETDTDAVTFTPDDWDQVQTVSITGLDDAIDDGNQSYTVTFSINTGLTLDSLYDTFSSQQVSGATVDNDVPAILISKTVGHITTEAGVDSTFTVSLNTAPQGDITVSLDTSDDSEGTPNPAQLTFDSSDYDSPKSVTIEGVDDDLVDGDVPYTIILTFSSTVSTEYYNGKQISVTAKNINDDEEAGSNVDLTFVPDTTLDFGSIYLGEEKFDHVTVINGGVAAIQLSVEVTGDAEFTARNTSSVYETGPFTMPIIPAGESRQLRVKYMASATEGTSTGQLIFLDGDSNQVKVLALSGTTMKPLNGGELRMAPALVVAEKSLDQTTADVDLAIELNTASSAATYIDLIFTVSLPSVIDPSSISLKTETSRTNGVQFASELNGSELTLVYTDFSGVGIAPGDGLILTISCTVDTSGAEKLYPVQLYNVSSTAVTGSYDIATVDGQLAVSAYVQAADLDVNDNGIADFRDVVLIYRYIRLGKTAEDDNLVLTGYDPDGVGDDAIQENIVVLRDNGLDVNDNGTPDFRDVVLIYRYVRLGKTAANGNLVLTGYDPNGIGGAAIEGNIQAILP